MSRHRPRADAARGARLSPAAACFLLGAVAVLAALATIWGLRLVGRHDVYVSGLGAAGMPTATAFNISLGVLGAGGLTLAAAGYLRSRTDPSPPLRTAASRVEAISWLSLFVAGACFLIAATTPCSAGCPVPGSAAFTSADATHLTAAITGFTLVCVSMLLVAVTGRTGTERRIALWTLIGVAGTSATGGLLALAGFGGGPGALLEFTAMTLGVLWAAVHAAPRPARTA